MVPGDFSVLGGIWLVVLVEMACYGLTSLQNQKEPQII
jgi:hypothetical protein